MKVTIIGGGAAGFFTAINIAEKHPEYQVTILEKGSNVLQKVKVSGGGRCNVTNARSNPAELTHFYPRGNKRLHPLFKKFDSDDMIDWLKTRGVETKAESDLRVFPTTDSSGTIIECFLALAQKKGILLIKNHTLKKLAPSLQGWVVHTNKGELETDVVVIATGSSPAAWKMLKELGLETTEVVPSLFTFNIKDDRIKDLPGVSFNQTRIKVIGSKLVEVGPLLITHWGLSGPAILKLSAWGAYELHAKGYRFEVLINFLNMPTEEAKHLLLEYQNQFPKRSVPSHPLFGLPKRFWGRLLIHCNIHADTKYGELSKKHINKLLEELTQGRYQVTGKSTFKEEFVTAGGVDLAEINLATFEAKRFPKLYLAGEVLNIDALTGGFNFQACWSAGWVISEHL